ncbi:MAG: PEP-CTERM sorting domain-containing protein [Gemmatimonas sp.]
MQKIIRRTLIASVCVAGILGNAASATAQTGYGQSFLAPSAPNTLLTGLSTTGMEGVATANPFLVQIFAFTGTNLVGPALFTQSLGTSFTGGFSVTPNINLVAGGLYVVLATAPADYLSRTLFYGGDFYAGGEAVNCGNGVCVSPPGGGIDARGFSATFAAATTVAPEPSTWALSSLGLLAVGFAARRRKQKA